MTISVVIPNYNGENILKKNIPKVIESLQSYQGDVEIIIPDDNSQDNSVELIRGFIQNNKTKVKIKLIENKINRGFSTNVNRGVGEATGDILLLLNSDVIPSKNFLEPLIENFKNEKVFAVGCLDESTDDGKSELRGRGVGKWERGFMIHSAGALEADNTLWVSGGSGAFRKDIWEKIGGLDEIYDPFYWEDIDLSYRAWKAGYICKFERESIVKHEHEKGAIKSKYSQEAVRKIVYRNQFIFVWKNADGTNLLKHFFWLPYHFANALLKDRIMLIGFFKALFMIDKVIRSRKKASKTFKISDNEVISNFS